ncbi:MAG: hypothetical protein ACOY4N_07205, partial [Pseudomonadota bacterium]
RIVPVRKIEETRLTCHHRLLRIADEVNQIRRSNARVFRGVQLVLMHIAGFLTPQSTQVVEQEIRANYSGPLIIGKDLQSIDLAK